MKAVTKTTSALATTLLLNACVPYPHSVTINPVIEGRVLSAASGQPVRAAEVRLTVRSDDSWSFTTRSDAEGRFVFPAHRDHRLFALLADAFHCWTDVSVSVPGYRTSRCGWLSQNGCSSAPPRLLPLRLQPEAATATEAESICMMDTP